MIALTNIKKYIYITRVSVSDAMVYVVDFFGRSIFYVFVIAIFLLLWKAIYANGEELIDGFNLNKMIWYLIITEMIASSSARIYSEVSNDVKSGNIAYLLNKPYNYIAYCFSNSIGKIMIALIVNSIVGLIIGYLFVGPLTGFNITILPFLVIAILLGSCLNFFINFALALSAFWVEENMPFRWIYQKLIFTLGGMMLPLDLFPDIIKNISKKLPFAYVTYAPAKLGVDFSLNSFKAITIIQLAYLLVAVLICLLMYRKGVKALNVNGG